MTNETKLKTTITGTVFKITHCEDALSTLDESLRHVEAKKAKSLKKQMARQIFRLANGERLSKENFPQEGNLPKKPGQSKTKKFNAFKRIPLRAYCWLSEKHRNQYFISHYVYKDYQKLKQKDTELVGKNWKRIEVDGHER